jgi:hypothetical protein
MAGSLTSVDDMPSNGYFHLVISAGRSSRLANKGKGIHGALREAVFKFLRTIQVLHAAGMGGAGRVGLRGCHDAIGSE